MIAELEKLRIHFAYCALILVLVIIAIATDRWTPQSGFTEYLSNAATMTSLVLGLVAIFYSFIANDGLSKSLGNINMVAETISQTKDQISNFLRLTSVATDVSKENAAQMQNLSSKISVDLSALTATLAEIKTQSATLHSSISELPTRLDKLETNVLDATKAVGEKIQLPSSTPATVPVDTTVVKRFLELSPPTGNLLAIACVLANKTDKPLVISSFAAAVEEKIDAYMAGFLASMHAAQLIKRGFVPDKGRNYTIKAVHPVLAEYARTYFTEYLARAYKDEPEELQEWLAKLAKVEALFS